MSRGAAKRRARAAMRDARAHARPTVDHTLKSLLQAYLALPEGSLVPTADGRLYVSDDALLFLRAMMQREAQLPPGSLVATLASMSPAHTGMVGHA